MTTIELILYSKPDCHLCEGLLEKLEKIRQPEWQLEIRDITSREDWFNAYQYEIPVLCQKLATGEKILPR
ncbi:MAG: glutaredoxin family protein, partial [Microcystis sp. M53600_WE12]|nr:glutaredoxin family protein [Microcystis sp. M53600_WE12]